MDRKIFELKLSDAKFIEKYEAIVRDNPDLIHEWRTTTGKVFQSCGSWKNEKLSGSYWIDMTAYAMKETLNKIPDLVVRCSLVGNCKRWYSKCQLKNVVLKMY